MKINTKTKSRKKTHEGAKACTVSPVEELRRSVMSCMLWECEFYEDGITISDRIASLVSRVDAEKVSELAIEAKERMKLRHVPLFMCVAMARCGKLKASVLTRCIKRADEISEFLAMYWKDGKCPISAQVKKGLADAFNNFGEYAFAKYNRKTEVKLVDAMFMVHPKPKNKEQEEIFKKLANDNLEVPDTWEVSLSSGGDKKEHWERLIKENKLGGLAYLRNLRNMLGVGIDKRLIASGLKKSNCERVLPMRFIVAAKHNPQIEDIIEEKFLSVMSSQIKLSGKTIIIIDVSGSMYGATVSGRSELDRANVACALATIAREKCEEPVIYATAGSDYTRVHQTQIVPNRRGFALSDAIYGLCGPLGGGGIFLKQVMDYVKDEQDSAERVIIITDEQDCDNENSPDKAVIIGKHNYIINVASCDVGISYSKYTHINGWSEAVLDYIKERENMVGMLE